MTIGCCNARRSLTDQSTTVAVLATIVLTLMCSPRAAAQQTIFNVPSADVTPKGKVFLQHESQFRPHKPDAFWLGTHYGAVGVGANTELAATLFNVSSPTSNNISLAVGFKSSIPILKERLKEREIKLVVGGMIPISFDNRGVGNWSYALGSARVPVLKTRVGAGVSIGPRQIFGRNNVSFICSYEQPVSSKFALIGDWYSGTHGNALFIPGFSVALPKAVNLYCGYQIPNNRQSGRTGFVIEIARTFL